MQDECHIFEELSSRTESGNLSMFSEPFSSKYVTFIFNTNASEQEKYKTFYHFTFTGKEKDEETGYGYFGARYMDHELTTMWLSVDPMADKYPNISPYNYCMWNPVRVIDPNGMDTIVFDGDGNFSNRIKADGNHVGRLLDKNGNKRFDFEFVCQQDADRCCSPGSQEEYDIYDRDKLSHAMDCPAEEKVPIYRIELVWQKEIISQLKESGACDKSFLPRIGYALRESDGGHLDFDNVTRHNGVWNDQTLYIPMVPGKKIFTQRVKYG
jgi:RHS repeat-associated protein